MAQTTVTYSLPGVSANLPFTASIVDANPTATTMAVLAPLLLQADLGTDPFTLVLGPWAQITPPPGAGRDGTFDMSISLGVDVGSGTEVSADNMFATQTMTESVHCQISNATPVVCTNSIAGVTGPQITPLATLSSPVPSQFKMHAASFYITAGAEKLASASKAAATHSYSSVASGSNTAASQSGSGTATGTSTAASSSTSQSHGNAASGMNAVNVGTMGLLGMVVAFFVR